MRLLVLSFEDAVQTTGDLQARFSLGSLPLKPDTKFVELERFQSSQTSIQACRAHRARLLREALVLPGWMFCGESGREQEVAAVHQRSATLNRVKKDQRLHDGTV